MLRADFNLFNMKKILLIVSTFGLLMSCGPKKVTPEIFLIPSGYRGTVNVIFNEPCGQKESKEGKKRLYIVPENGILITQFKMELGIINEEFYYIDAKGGRTSIPKMMLSDFNEETTTKRNENEPPRDQVGVFQWGNTGMSQWEGEQEYNYYSFYIGTYTEVRDSFSTLYGSTSKYEHVFDSLTHAQINLCRSATTQ